MPNHVVEKTEKEVHNTQLIDKQRAGITYSKEKINSMTDGEREFIEIRDEDSQKAFETFKKVRKELK